MATKTKIKIPTKNYHVRKNEDLQKRLKAQRNKTKQKSDTSTVEIKVNLKRD